MDASRDRTKARFPVRTSFVFQRIAVERIGNATFAAALAAALASLPAALRLAQADGSFPMAWALLAAIALVPMAILVPLFRAAREGLRAWGGDGLGERIAGFGAWLGAMLIFMLRFGTALRAKTHHHALAGVTFAVGALVIAVVLGIVAVRLVRWAATDRERGSGVHTVVFGVVIAVVALVLFRSIPTSLSAEARGAAIDGTAALVASILAASKTLEAKPRLARLGGLLAAAFVILALFSSASLLALVPLAPLHAALTGILSALR